jgi:ATP-binding cassette subfamily B protein
MKFLEIKKSISTLARTFVREIGLVFRFHPGTASALAVTQLIIGLMPAAVLFFTADIVSIVAKQEGEWSQDLVRDLVVLLILLLVQRIAFQFFDYFQDRLMNLLYLSVSNRIHQKIITLDLPTLEKSETQTMITFFRDQNYRPYNMVRSVFNFFGNIVSSISFIVIAWRFSPLLITIFVLALIPGLIAAVKAVLDSQHLTWGKTFIMKRTWYLQNLFSGITSITELLVHGAVKKMTEKYRVFYGDIVEKERQISAKKLFSGLLTNLLAFAAYVWAYISLVTQAITGAFSVGDFTLYAGAFVNAERFLVSQVWQFVLLFENVSYLEKFYELEAMESTIKNISGATELVDKDLEIEFKNVSYNYSDSDQKVLQNISFVLKPGERVALVGENGAGKTTLIKLLLRLYEPTSGQILINGKDIQSYTLESLRKRIAVTFQDFLKLALTARENIALGVGGIEIGLEEARAAAIRSGADDKISSLPKGYETCLGRGWEDDGVELSGGEWQKVALARSLIKDASLLVLDEPTAALDARSEFNFFQELFNREGNISLFLISHRFSSVRVADRILVLQKGKLIESGTHEELIKKNGLYRELYELQLKEIN